MWCEKAPNPTQRMRIHIIIILFSIQNELYGKLLLLFISWTFLGCVPLSFFFFFLRCMYLSLAVLGLHCWAWAFSSCGEQGLLPSCSVWASYCRGFPCCGAQAPGCVGFSGSANGLSCLWNLPRPGIKPVSPALAGGFLTTSHQGSPASSFLMLDNM